MPAGCRHAPTRAARRAAAAVLCAMLVLCARVCGQECATAVKAADSKAYAAALATSDLKRAAQQMRKVAARNPKAADPQYALGMMAVADGFNATAIRRYFTRCIELCPDYPKPLAHYYMGVIHYTDSRYAEATAELEQYFALANGQDDREARTVYEEASNYLYWSQFLLEAELNAAPFDPHKVRGVSSKHNEMLPFLTADGQTFYYLREMPVRKERTFYAQELEEKRWMLCRSRWRDTAFTAGEVMPAPFNQGGAEGGVSLTADGRTLYYSIIRYDGTYANSDLYVTTRDDNGGWRPVSSVGQQVNGARTWESQPSVTADGQTLYFASNRAGGLGGTDIWRCRRLKNGDWSRPENLGPSVNTAGNEKFPFIHADGHTLYFVSDGWQGFGGYDLYFANINYTYANRPTNLGLPINTEADELSMGVTADGRKAYYTCKMQGARSADVYMFDLYPAARPEAMSLCRIAVQDTLGRPLQAVATVGGARYEARDGTLCLMLSMENDNTVTVVADGMMPEVMAVRAQTVRSQAAGRKQALRRVALVPVAEGAICPLAVGFGADGSLDEASLPVVDAYARWLIDNPRVHLAVQCPKAAQAKAVYDRLRASGLRADRLGYRGGTDIKTPQLVVTP